MAKLESLKDIKVSAAETAAEVRKPKRDKFGRSYATGKEKMRLPAYGLNRVKATSRLTAKRWTNILPVRF